MTKKQKKVLIRIIIAALLTAVFCFLPVENPYVRLGLFLIPYLVIGYDILRKAVLGILHGEVFDENFLMACRTGNKDQHGTDKTENKTSSGSRRQRTALQ